MNNFNGSPYFFIARINILMALAYRFDVVSSILAQILLMASTVFIWQTAYNATDAVEGISRSQMLVYGVISSALGLLFSAGVAGTITNRIREGQISTDLLRPVHPLLLWLSEDIGKAAASFVLKAGPLLLCGILLVGGILPASPSAFLIFLPAVILSYGIIWLMTALVGMIAFWTLELGQLDMVKNALMGVLSGSFVPLWFFPDYFQRICQFLPFVYTYQGTLGIYIGKIQGMQALQVLGIQLLWIAILTFLLRAVWERARSKVQVQGG